MNKKMEWLLFKKRKSDMQKIKHIQYRWKQNDVTSTNKSFSFSLPHHEKQQEVHDSGNISLHPSSFTGQQLSPSFSSLREKWFLNLSSYPIPKNVQYLIQLGDNFSLPIFDKNKARIEFIKSIECSIKKFPKSTHINIRNRSIPILNELSSLPCKKDTINDHLHSLEKQTLNFFKNNGNIILTRADKGNITVALDKENYIRKMEEMLQNDNIYINVKKDPTRSIIGNLRKLLTRWKNSEFISTTTHRTLTSSDGLLPRAYGLPKVHKTNCPFRIIISSVNSPLYAIASFLQKTITTNTPSALFHIDNSFDLVKKTNKHTY